MIHRFLFSIAFISIFCAATTAQVATVGKPLPAWQKGYLDIYHINTGRGNAAYFLLPDGTSMLIDAGELSPLDERTFTARNAVIRPDSSQKPFDWIAQFISRVTPAGQTPAIDYALITHFHDDHFGAWYPAAPRSKSGAYQLTGITGVGERIPIRTLIDRAYPAYNYPFDFKKTADLYKGGEVEFAHTIHNYFAFIKEKQQQGMKMAPLCVGSDRQLVLLRDAAAFPAFSIRNLKSNGDIWTGKDSATYQHFPGFNKTDRSTWPDENSLSLALLLRYGAFSYYTGGDNPGNVFLGDNPLRDVESPMARAIGEVDIATMDHHGNRDAINENQIKILKPRVWIGQTWSSDHPGHEVLIRLMSPYLYKEPRDLFATNMLEANRLVIGSLIDRSYKSQQGHIVVRVLPGGSSYYVIILDDTTTVMPVKAVFGPYTSKTSSTATQTH